MQWRWKLAQAAEIRWWKRYLKNKDQGEYLQWKRAYWQAFLKQSEHRLEVNERVLDAGCGPAGIFTILNEQRVDALDPLLELYEAQALHFSKKAYPKVQFFAQALEHFTPQTPYDTVFCLNAINHVADLHLALDTLAAATRRGGHLLISIDTHNYAFFKHLFRLLPSDILHPHQHDLADYKQMLAARNFELRHQFCQQRAFFFDYYVLVLQKK